MAPRETSQKGRRNPPSAFPNHTIWLLGTHPIRRSPSQDRSTPTLTIHISFSPDAVSGPSLEGHPPLSKLTKNKKIKNKNSSRDLTFVLSSSLGPLPPRPLFSTPVFEAVNPFSLQKLVPNGQNGIEPKKHCTSPTYITNFVLRVKSKRNTGKPRARRDTEITPRLTSHNMSVETNEEAEKNKADPPTPLRSPLPLDTADCHRGSAS